MPRTKKLANFERVSVINLRKSELSFRKIGATIGCHHSTVIRICKCNEKSASPDKLKRCGRPKSIYSGREHKFTYLKAITNELTSIHLHGNLFKWIVKRVLKKYGIRNHARRRKPFVSFQSRKARIRWANAVWDWRVPQW